MVKKRFYTIFVLLLAVGQVVASDYQSHHSIKQAVKNFLIEQVDDDTVAIRVKVGKLDKRLHLRQCELPLEVFTLPNARLIGATTVGVKCDGSKPWKLFVRARVEKLGMVTLPVEKEKK